MAQVTIFDFVLLLMIAETSGQTLGGNGPSVTNTLVVIVTLVLEDVALSYAKSLWSGAGAVIDGPPTVLIAQGVVQPWPCAALVSRWTKSWKARGRQRDRNGGISIIPKPSDEKTPP